MYRIGMEDIAANYFIYNSLLNNKSKFIRWMTLMNYGKKAIQKLYRLGKEATLDCGREARFRIFEDNKDFFSCQTDNKEYFGIMLRDGISRLDLAVRFLGVIPVDVQKVLEEVIRKEANETATHC